MPSQGLSASLRGQVAHGTVVVPSVGQDYFAGYDRMHARGLRVTIRARFSLPPFGGGLSLVATRPITGTRVRSGTAVTFVLGRSGFDPLGSPALPVPPWPSFAVPSFVGKVASAALVWADRRNLYFAATFGPLIAGDAPDLFANYRITHQDPAPGTPLSYGIGIRHGNSASFKPTPLTVQATQLH